MKFCENCGALLQDSFLILCPNCGIPLNFLENFIRSIPEVKAAFIVSMEGLPIASSLPQGVDETKMAAMTASLLSLAERTILEMKKGEFDQLYIKGSDGYILFLKAGPNAVLTVSATKDVRFGLIFLDCKRICQKIAKLISNGFDFDDKDYFPFPYISKSPTPPEDLSLVGQLQPKRVSNEEELRNKPYCKHCGTLLPEGQSICHVCGKKVI